MRKVVEHETLDKMMSHTLALLPRFEAKTLIVRWQDCNFLKFYICSGFFVFSSNSPVNKRNENLLRSSDAKNKLTKYIVDSWKEDLKRIGLRISQILFVTYGEECIRFSAKGFQDVPELHSNQEEVDTRMMLHIQHASILFV